MRNVRLILSGLLGAAALSIPAPAPARTGIVADSQGRLYFVDPSRGRVWRLDRDGRLTALARGERHDFITLRDNGSLSVLHQHDPIQMRWVFHDIAPDGAITEMVRQSPIPNPAGALTMDGAGAIYFMNLSELLMLGADGQVSVWARPLVIQGPRAAGFGPAGALYVIDSNGVRLARQGVPEATFLAGGYDAGQADARAGAARFDRPTALTVDSAGNVYVADFGNARVRKIAPDGQVSTVAESRGAWRPTGVTLADGRVYILERARDYDSQVSPPLIALVADLVGSPRIRRLDPDGTVVTVAHVRRWPVLGSAAALPAVLAAALLIRRAQRRSRS